MNYMSSVDELLDFLHERIDDMLDADAANREHVVKKRKQLLSGTYNIESTHPYVLKINSEYWWNRGKINKFRERIYNGQKPLTYNEATAKIELLKNLIAQGKTFEDCDWQNERTVCDINEYLNKYDLLSRSWLARDFLQYCLVF